VTVAVEAASLGPRARAARATVPGVAAVGRVVDSGPDGRHLIGARVVIGPHQACGECDVCRRGGAAVCPVGQTLGIDAPGTAAVHVIGRARWVLPLDADLAVPGPAAAVLGYEAALAYALYARAGVGPGEPTVVIGDGAVARLLVDVLVAKHAAPVVATADDGLGAWAAGRGAAVVARAGDLATAVRDAHAARGHGARPWKLFACDGDPEAALSIAGPRATVAIAALEVRGDSRLGAAVDREVTAIGVRGAHPDLMPEVAALAVRGELDVAGATELVPLADVAAALARPPTSRALVAIV
jgi:threonine dehydrogenase-like Zn-dependent dehydrogenase